MSARSDVPPGTCGECRCKPARPNRKTCARSERTRAVRQSKSYQRKVAKGCCGRCGRPSGERSYCPGCNANNSAASARFKARRNAAACDPC